MRDGSYTLNQWADLHEALDLEQELAYRESKKGSKK